MFTGIVAEAGSVVSVSSSKLVIAAEKVLEGIQPGGSIAVNGICLTVTEFTDSTFSVDVMPETLRRTNLGQLHNGDRVNLERPLGLGGEIGGHLVQGHIDGTGKVIAIDREGEAALMKFEAPADLMRYVVEKGFIAVDGTSLTVVEKDATSFSVSIVGFTREHTILADRKISDTVNLEVDIIGKYVAEFMKPQGGGITAEFLEEHGFAIN
ncbi:MAG: riboflavin synthase [Dehalococcoidales bacterium]|nr:riboflavin synthase [Dehalococcoidales bacterium]